MPSCPKNLTTDKKNTYTVMKWKIPVYIQEIVSPFTRTHVSCTVSRNVEHFSFLGVILQTINNPSQVIYTVCKITPKKLKCYNILIIVELVNLCNIERGTRTFKILLFGDFFVRVKLISDSKRNCGKIYELSELYYIPNIPDISISNTFIKKIYSEN